MKPFNVFLILRHFIFAALIMALGACSFKKDPVKSQGQENPIEIQQSKAPTINLESVVSQSDSQKAIEELTKIRIENINGQITTDGTLLDTAIRLEKVDLIHYLVLRGANPFQLSDASHKKMEHSQTINDVLVSLHKDIFFNILRVFPREVNDETEYASYDLAISKENLGPVGCLQYVDFLMNIKFFWRSPIGSGIYYEGASSKDITSVILRTLNTGACSQYKSQFNLIKVSEWISAEFIHQFYQDFGSADFIKALLNLPKERFFKIKITNSFDHHLPRQLRVDPLAFIVLKKICLTEEEFNTWYDLFLKMDRGGYNFSDTFRFGTESEIQACSHRSDCTTSDSNKLALMVIFKGLISKSEHDVSAFDSYIYNIQDTGDDLEKNDLDKRKRIKNLICARNNEEGNE